MPGCCREVLAAVIIPNAGGVAGSFIVRRNLKPWYEGLKKPEWSPPNWVYGPMWCVLYSGIGYGSYLVYKDGGGCTGAARVPLMVYGTNLAFNWAWTPLFFGCHNLKLALIDIGLIDATAIAATYLFYKVNKKAGYLFIPYLLWLGVASTLTYKIFKSNRIEETPE